MLLIIDACVLIDYAKTDKGVLRLASSHLGRVYVPRVVLDEVDQLTEQDCQALGIELVDPDEQQLLQAQSPPPGLSFQDSVCLLLARDHGWTCVTNDVRLRTGCGDAGVAVQWGLDLMLHLVQRGQLDVAKSRRIAENMHRSNASCITKKVLARFTDRLKKAAPSSKKKRRS